MELPKLNFPPFEAQIQQKEGKLYILDLVRRKYVRLLPEEWVRQHVVNLLLSRGGYVRSLLTLESGLKYNKIQKRSDLLAYDRGGKPFLLIECKAPQVRLNDSVLRQAAVYNQIIRAPYLGITNGLQHYFCRVHFEENRFEFLSELPAFPDHAE